MKDTNLWRLAQRLHAPRQLLHGRARRLVPEPHLAGLRLRARLARPARRASARRSTPRATSSRTARVTARATATTPSTRRSRIFLNNGRQGENVLPPQHAVTIGDRLTEKGVHWAWYSGGWSLAAKSDRTPEEDKLLQARPSSGTTSPSPISRASTRPRRRAATSAPRISGRIDSRPTSSRARSRRWPSTSPSACSTSIRLRQPRSGRRGGRPASSSSMDESPMKDSFAVVITYDENGGFWDHVAPPQGPAAGAAPTSSGRAHACRRSWCRLSPARAGGPHRLRHHLDPEADRRAPPARPAAERALRRGREPREGLRLRETVGGPKASGTSGTDPAFSHHGGSPRLSLAPPQLQAKV